MPDSPNTRGALTVGRTDASALLLAAAQLDEGAYVPEVRAGARLQAPSRATEPVPATVAPVAAAVTPVATPPVTAPVVAPVVRRGFFARLLARLLGRG
ncbi:hypothetical protein ACFFKU_01335 [Kineococcus gynurae]|uniref:Uncharacterized protein n=1 Tax=Kineococcus gynurae TaxID=452979 RepID=A0ABV5LQ22_9ACTN